jgi:CDP-diacylglycerol--glycerol-3-phosphate 3-phosphatidyltransferase
MGLANKISILRILLIPFFVASLLYYHPEQDGLRFVALAIFFLGALTDTVDGNIARAKKEKTRLGTFLDPIADKLLLITAFISLSMIKQLPAGIRMPIWVPLIIISRDIILFLGAALIHVVTGSLEIHPTRLGKITTFMQMATVIGVLLQWKFSYFLWSTAILFTLISGIDYIMKGTSVLSTE